MPNHFMNLFFYYRILLLKGIPILYYCSYYFFVSFIFWFFETGTLIYPPYPIIPNPFYVSLNSSSAFSPKVSLFYNFLKSVNAYLSFIFLYFFPPLFFLGLSSGAGKGLFSFGGGGSYILSNLCNICSLIRYPADPFKQVRAKSIRIHLATFDDKSLTNFV